MMNIRNSISTLVSRNDTAPGSSNSMNGMLALALASMGLLVLAGCSPRDLDSSSVDASPSVDSGQAEAVAAIVEGRAITISEIDEHMKDQFLEEFLKQPEERQFEMRETAARDLVQRRVIEDEANKQGKTSQELLDEIANSVSEPTVEEVTAWYSENQSRLRGAKLEDVAGAIKDVILKERRAKAMSDFLDPKLEALSWKIVLSPPRKELETTRLVRGDAEAPVTIMVFSDYQCPYCVRAEPVLAEVLERYPDQVRVVHRHFPLDNIHPFARPASEAAMCADEQGKFWEYHDGIFARQGKLEDGSFAEIGSAVGLDADDFKRCVEERRYKDFVEADFVAGGEAGVSGTPSFFLNGIKLTGARDANELSRYVDIELARIEDK
jgi:predicted DsbA family dithiol-disulfide isomerase